MSKGRQAALDRLRHMQEAAKAVAGYVDRGRTAFDADSAIRDAIVYQIVVIGEAAKGVSAADQTFTARAAEVDWSAWAKMRDRLTHQYWHTDREIVWQTASQDIPRPIAALANILSET